MKKYYAGFLLICLLKTTLAFGQSNVGISPSAYLTSLPPEIPTLLAPATESTELLDPVELIWKSQIHTYSYTLQVSEEADFSSLLVDQSSLSDTLYALTGLENNTRYYWRVKASNVAGESDYSSVWEFRTIVALPDDPVLVEPEDDKADTPVDVNLKWNSVEGAASYVLQVSQESDFSTLLVDQSSLSDTLYSLTGLENNIRYYWRVKAINVAGESDYSSVWEFTTIVALPDIPVLVEPIDDMTDTPVDVDLKWNSVEGSASYTLQVSEEADFSSLLVDQSSLSDTLYSLTGLENNTRYYWRVMASNVAGGGSFSEEWSFTTLGTTGIDWAIASMPDGSLLMPPYPNPFHSSTTFRYFIPDQTKVHITIYNILGQEVRGLMWLDQQAGKHEVKWDGRDDYGAPLPDGLYICILSCNESVCLQKVLLKR